MISKREILWHCRLETNVNIDIVMESWYLNQFRFKMKSEMIRKFFLIPLKILEWGEEEHDERLQCPFHQVSVVKTGDKATDKLSAGEEYCTMKKKAKHWVI